MIINTDKRNKNILMSYNYHVKELPYLWNQTTLYT